MSFPAQNRFEEPLARAYRHDECGGETVVSGDDYVLLECPFRPVDGTYCCSCDQYVPLSSIVWCDSLENVAEYRQRLYASVPVMRKLYLLWLGNAYEGAINLNLDSSGKRKN